MLKPLNSNRQSAFTLIEIIVTIVLISISATAIMSVFTSTVRSSANPMILQQAVSIAEAYMEEILLKSYDDPDGLPNVVESDRRLFDNVSDYDGLNDVGAVDQNGNSIPSLSDYTVAVTVTGTTLNTVPALLIRVSVAHTVLAPIVLHGYRTDY